MKELMFVILTGWAAISIVSYCGEFCEIEKTIREIEAKTERMKADPRPKYVTQS